MDSFRAAAPAAVALTLAAVSTGAAASDGVRICNRGTIALAVAYLDDRRALLNSVNFWRAQGWQQVFPNECSTVWRDDGIVHLVFGIQGPRGDFGVIKLDPERNNLPPIGINNRRSSMCVTLKEFDESGTNSPPARYLPPCTAPFKEVPVSTSYRLEGRAQVELTARPTERDLANVAVSFTEPTRTGAQRPGSLSFVHELLPGTSIRVAARVDSKTAAATQERYRAHGFPTYAVQALFSDDRFNVFIGPYANLPEAASALKRLERTAGTPAGVELVTR